jgi:hypothetical protein
MASESVFEGSEPSMERRREKLGERKSRAVSRGRVEVYIFFLDHSDGPGDNKRRCLRVSDEAMGTGKMGITN